MEGASIIPSTLFVPEIAVETERENDKLGFLVNEQLNCAEQINTCDAVPEQTSSLENPPSVSHEFLDFNEIDPVSSKSTSISEVEDGQIVESSSDCSDIIRDQPVKRCLSSCDDERPAKKSKKRISFSAVTAYYFPRAQGFTCIPSQGGSTLGMALKHSHVESLTLGEHASQQRKNHRKLLVQIKKKRKNRSSNNLNPEGVSNLEKTELKSDIKESDSDESEDQQISDMSDSELDVDNYYFLQPVPTRQRRALLRESGVAKIETSEKDDCRQIRVSRESCGCSCQVYCEPESCSCAQSGIQCQVDRLNFPCGCSRDACANPSGRIEFNPVRVRTHFIHTLMRLELENADDSTKVSGGQPQALPPADEIAALDNSVAPTAVSDQHYSWENTMQLVPAPQQQQLTSYDTNSTNLLGDNGWYNLYANEPANYALYSGAPNSTEVFNYDLSSYEATDHRLIYNEASEGTQQYTELVDSGQGYTSEYYQDYSQLYGSFDSNGFSYNTTDNTFSSCTEEVYSYADSGAVGFNLNGSSSDSSAEAAPKVESSSSSSEEDTLELGSSLATIVKETMVSV